MKRVRWVAAGLTAVLFAAFVLALPAGASGQKGDTVAASVPPGSQVGEGNGRFYLLNAGGGATVTQKLRVTNTNDHPIDVVLEAIDANTSNDTGVAFAQPGSAKSGMTRWIVMSSPGVTLSPKEQRDIPFTVHVPNGVKAGQYLAGVSASVPLTDDDGKHPVAPNQAGFTVNFAFQRTIAVEVDVPGPRAPQLVVTGADPQATPDGVTLGIHIANQGNAFAHGTGVVSVADTKTDLSFKVDTFLAGSAITYPVQWTKTVVAGAHHVQVDLQYEDGRRTSWNGDINIAGDLQSRLEDALNNVTVRPAGSGMNPWVIVAIVLGVLFVVGAILLRRRSRRPRYVKYRAA